MPCVTPSIYMREGTGVARGAASAQGLPPLHVPGRLSPGVRDTGAGTLGDARCLEGLCEENANCLAVRPNDVTLTRWRMDCLHVLCHGLHHEWASKPCRHGQQERKSVFCFWGV